MIKTEPLSIALLDQLINSADRSSIEYFEHKALSDQELKNHLYNKLRNTIGRNGAITYVAIENSGPVGFISAELNDFDSRFFGFPCVHLTINVFSSSYEKVREIIIRLLNETENYYKQYDSQFYTFISINNNTFNCRQIFNSLAVTGFCFISTLLTYSVPDITEEPVNSTGQGFSIREAGMEDIDAVASLAEKSFHYSRFHMDPFLDNRKADLLLKTSAENSIKENFVDIMFVAEIKNKIVGYYSAKKKYIEELNRTFGISVISAVDPEYQGMGIFRHLDDHILFWYVSNCDISEVGSYLGNIPVHRTWAQKKLKLLRGTYQLSRMHKFRT